MDARPAQTFPGGTSLPTQLSHLTPTQLGHRTPTPMHRKLGPESRHSSPRPR